ncbi:hypothetical protein [Saccharopolyspora shandongensis]|uniref:hypothetical protein n=1 Tax=Saccharopolyspora shandongensis TaxID=418495 RepID=UPI00340D9719
MRWGESDVNGRRACDECGHARSEHSTQGCMADVPYTRVDGVGRVDCPCGLYWTNDYTSVVEWPCGCGHRKHNGECHYPGCLCGHEQPSWQIDPSQGI